MTENGIRINVSVSRKVNLGNYESEDIFLSLSNIDPAMTTAQEIGVALEAADVAWIAIRKQVDAKVSEIVDQRAAMRRGTS